jgi:acyl-CoA synthetase (NDP forming)
MAYNMFQDSGKEVEMAESAETATVKEILEARSLALVGASSKPFKFGSLFLASLLTMGFEGNIYPSLAALPEVPDLVYFTVPAYQSMEVLKECVGLGIKAVVIMAAGFREAGPQGEELEHEALRLAREGGFRIIGPNCFGIYNPRTGLTLLPGFDFSHTPGPLAFISQSGGFAAHFGRLGMGLGMDFSAILSYGNASDVSEVDLFRHFLSDDGTEIICGYIEGTRDGRALYSVLKETAARKPVILWKVGRGEVARRAVASHTGSLAGSAAIWDDLFRQCGVIPAEGLEEMAAIAQCFYRLGRRPARRLLVLGGGGAICTHAADLAERHGLELPRLAEVSETRLREMLPPVGAVVANPLDIGTPLTPPAIFTGIADAVASDTATDLFLFDLAINFGAQLLGEEGVRACLKMLVDAAGAAGKPCAFNLYNRAPDNLEMVVFHARMKEELMRSGALVFEDLSTAFRALAAYAGYSIKWGGGGGKKN